MATNDTFYRKTKIFVVKSLEVLEEIKDRGGIPLGPPQKEISIEESSGGEIGTTSRFVQKPDFSYFILKNWEKIKELPEYGECTKCMHENETINKHLDTLVGIAEHGRFRLKTDTYLQGFILKLISESESLKFNEKIFTEYFEKLRNFFTNDKIQVSSLAPLEGFTADINEIPLNNKLRIFKLPTHKLEELLRNGRCMPIPDLGMLNCSFGIERIFVADKIIGVEFGRHTDIPTQETETVGIFDEVISALRLLKPGTVGYNFIRSEALDWNPGGGVHIHGGTFTYPYFGNYHLKTDEIEDFKEIFKKLNYKYLFSLESSYNQYLKDGSVNNKLKKEFEDNKQSLSSKAKVSKIDEKHWEIVDDEMRCRIEDAGTQLNIYYKLNFLDMPLRYFNYAHMRERPEDKLIDYIIAFESLFIKEMGELSYRLSLGVAAFLGANLDEKGEIFTLMRKAYKLRSDIVHGSSYSKSIEIKGKFLFSWNNVPGDDSERLLRFFRDDLDIVWVENAEIRKSDDGKTISIFKNEISAEIVIAEKKKKATINISDGKILDLKTENKNGKLNIHEIEKLSIEELVSRVEELLRKSIKKSIKTEQKPDQILENSPESIFV